MLLAPLPILAGIAALVVKDAFFTDFAFAAAFLIGAGSVAYIGLVRQPPHSEATGENSVPPAGGRRAFGRGAQGRDV